MIGFELRRASVKLSLRIHDRVHDYERDVIYVYGPRDVHAFPITGTLWAAMKGLTERRALDAVTGSCAASEKTPIGGAAGARTVTHTRCKATGGGRSRLR